MSRHKGSGAQLRRSGQRGAKTPGGPGSRGSRVPVKVRDPWFQRAPWWGWVGAVLVPVAVAVVLVVVLSGGGSQSEQSPLLAPTAPEPSGQAVNGIECGTHEQAIFHIHAHLAVFVGGNQRTIPEGIGIAPPREESQTDTGPFVASGSCFYWLHTHTADGIIHIEAPLQRTFTLGDFFAVWGQPLSVSQVGPAHGTVIAYVDGQRVSTDPRSIPLTAHAVIQLDVNGDTAPQPYTFPAGL